MDDTVDLDREIRWTPAVERTNCWSCGFSNADTTNCENPDFGVVRRTLGEAIGDWIAATHPPPPQCPRSASGCPGWTPREKA